MRTLKVVRDNIIGRFTLNQVIVAIIYLLIANRCDNILAYRNATIKAGDSVRAILADWDRMYHSSSGVNGDILGLLCEGVNAI